jgi:hypothetical protein
VAITVVAVAVQATFITDRSRWLSWAGLAVQAFVTWIVVSALIRIRVGMRRGLAAGLAAGDREGEGSTAERSTGENLARTGGRALGRALAAYRQSQTKR